MSARGGWEAWGAASASATCVVRGVKAVLSGKYANAVCLLLDEAAAPGRHAPSGGCSTSQGMGAGGSGGGGVGGVPKEGGGKGGCSVNSVAVGALYAHMQW